MKRLPVIAFWIAVIVGTSFTLYRVKYEVQSLKAQIVETSQEMAKEREALHVASAEWAYLNRPERLKALADKYLAGSSVTVGQVAEVEAIAFHEQSVADADIDAGMDSDTRAILASYRGSYHR